MTKEALKSINIDLPVWIVKDLDREAEHLGINRKALIKVMLASILRTKKGQKLVPDLGYVKAVEKSFAEEWGSKEDDDAFRNL